MPKKLITVAWSYTVEVEVPENLSEAGIDEFDDFGASKEIDEIVNKVCSDAGNEFSWKDLVITDVQDA